MEHEKGPTREEEAAQAELEAGAARHAADMEGEFGLITDSKKGHEFFLGAAEKCEIAMKTVGSLLLLENSTIDDENLDSLLADVGAKRKEFLYALKEAQIGLQEQADKEASNAKQLQDESPEAEWKPAPTEEPTK